MFLACFSVPLFAMDLGLEASGKEHVLADTPIENNNSLIVVGAHLDSVPEGPGINDNGSGSAAVLEAALRLAKEPIQTRSRLRFASEPLVAARPGKWCRNCAHKCLLPQKRD